MGISSWDWNPPPWWNYPTCVVLLLLWTCGQVEARGGWRIPGVVFLDVLDLLNKVVGKNPHLVVEWWFTMVESVKHHQLNKHKMNSYLDLSCWETYVGDTWMWNTWISWILLIFCVTCEQNMDVCHNFWRDTPRQVEQFAPESHEIISLNKTSMEVSPILPPTHPNKRISMFACFLDETYSSCWKLQNK